MTFAVILSGGIGKRMNMEGYPKQYLTVNGKPVLVYALETFQNEMTIDKIVIVAADQWQNDIREWVTKYNINKFIGFAMPGTSRQESILSGLETCATMSAEKDDLVVVHDGVRPLVSKELIHECVMQLQYYDGCMPIVPVTDTIYCSADGNIVSGLLDRNILFGGQTPEGYNFRKYLDINQKASVQELKATKGSSEIAFKYGMTIKTIKGEEINFKITTFPDLQRFQDIVEKQ